MLMPKKYIRKCPSCGRCTLQEECPSCGTGTVTAHPPRFSPEDRHALERALQRLARDTRKE